MVVVLAGAPSPEGLDVLDFDESDVDADESAFDEDSDFSDEGFESDFALESLSDELLFVPPAWPASVGDFFA